MLFLWFVNTTLLDFLPFCLFFSAFQGESLSFNHAFKVDLPHIPPQALSSLYIISFEGLIYSDTIKELMTPRSLSSAQTFFRDSDQVASGLSGYLTGTPNLNISKTKSVISPSLLLSPCSLSQYMLSLTRNPC